MKKIFLFLSAVLVSLAMQATVVTKTVDWQLEKQGSSKVEGNVITAKAWSGAEKWNWLTGASQYDQLVLEVADHTKDIQFKAIFSDGTADVSPASVRVLPAGFNEIAVDVTADVLHYIEVLNASGTDDVEITINRIYLRGAVGETEEIFPWQGSKSFDDWDWNQRVLIAPEKFNDLHVGDIVELAYTTNAESYHQIQIKFEYDNTYPKFSPFQIDLGGSSESGVLRFCITNEDDLTDIASKGGIYLNGKFITFTKVSVSKHEVLWTGEQIIGKWSGNIEIPASKLSDLQIGNEICVRVTAIGDTDGPRVSLFCGWSLSDALVGGEYYFQGGDAASSENPFIVRFPVTGSMKQQLGSHNMLLRGVNYTVTDVYVEEGTPVAESGVKGYLTVSTAGMATFVLPFNVLTLPEGVQAYDLTNDGSNVILATEVNALTADQPVLIIAAAGEYAFDGEDGSSADISGKTGTYANGALIGTYQTIDHLAENDGAGNNNYVLQNHGGEVAFYQVKDNSCSVAPYRAYLSCGYNAASAAPGAPARMRLVFNNENTTTGMESVQQSINNQKILRNGQILIIRDNKMFNVLGQQL